MKKSLIYGLILTTALCGCKGDYDDWASPQSNAAKEVADKFVMTATPQTTQVDFATETADTLTLFTTNLTEGQTSEYTVVFSAEDNEATTTLTLPTDGKVATSDLESAITGIYGRAPQARTVSVTVSALVNIASEDGTVVASKTSEPFTLVGTPNAPYISQHYYLIGAPSAWDPACTSMPFSHSGKDVYEDPVFTVTFPVTATEMWFAISDDKTVEGVSNWDLVLGCVEGNGANGTEGKIARRTDLSDDGSWKITVDGDAKFVKMTINMMDYTYKLEKLNFQEYLYMAGDANGWNQVDFVSSPAFDGEYTGFMYLTSGGFKFCTQQDWSGTNYGEDFSTDGGAGNMTLPADNSDGYYKVDLSLVSKTMTLTEITTIGVIGDATPGGWDASTPLTFNKADRCWEGDVTFTDGTFKFRANDAWAINWGGNTDNLAMDGDNISVTAGTYHVALYPNCPGKARCTLTKQ